MRWTFVLAALAVPQVLSAQLAEGIGAMPDGTARFSYATRPEVEICDRGIRVGDRRMWWRSRGRDDVSRKCRRGVAEVELEVRDGLVREVDIVRDLLDMATDRRLHEGVRKKTLFWLGQEAADAATHGLAEVALDEDEGQEIRNSAIFALSQRPPDEGIPVLMEVARSGEEPETRRTAMFWLAQSNDERVVDFFEEILLGRIR